MSPSPSSSDYEGPVPAYVSAFPLPFQEDVFDVEDSEWDEPFVPISSKTGNSRTRDPVLDSAMTGLEAEAMIRNTGETFSHRWSPRPWLPRTRPAFSVIRYRPIRVWI